MSRIPADILDRLAYFHREVEELFRKLFEEESPALAPRGDMLFPLVDVVDEEGDILVRADLPGIVREDLELFGAPKFLVIRGRKRAEGEAGTCLRLERVFGPFQRLVTLPASGDVGRAEARFEQGVLEVQIPKVAERRRLHRTIPID